MPTPKHAQPLGATPSAGQLSLPKALFDAIRDGDSRAVINLAPLIDDLDSHQDSFRLDHPLTAAARYDLPSDAVEALLGRSNPLLADKDGFTALMLACWGDESHSVDVVRRLLPASNPMAVTASGDSALHFAISVGNPESVALLLPVSDPLARSMDGDTALHFSIFAHRVDIVELLLPASDLQSPNFAGNPPLEQALGLASSRDTVQAILAEMARRERVAISGAARQPMPKLHAPSRL